MLQSKQYNHFIFATLISLAFASVIAVFILLYGKQSSFLMLHFLHTDFLDYFFRGFTYLGDGLIYFPIVLFCFFFRKDFLLPVITGIIICTLLTHFFKRIIYPEELRPVSLEKLLQYIKLRRVLGLELAQTKSFPSGHTATAFTMSLLLVYLSNDRIWSVILPVMALLVGYSRIYLGQHYVTDVLAGMMIGIVSAFISLQLYKGLLRKKARKAELKIERIS